jgi:flagellar motor protein MotB|tara:strand:- start:149 stop:469 length:321 start_codon:yes stop_codon:yes gene_type:complete
MSKKKEMSTEECMAYVNKMKEQNRLRQQRFIDKKKATGEYEAYNEARTEYKREYRKKPKDNDNNDKLKIEYNLKTLKELKDIAKSKELKNISKTNKAELIEMLIKI